MPAKTGPSIAATRWDIVDVLPDGRVALAVGPIYVGGAGSWREEQVPCRRTGTLLGGDLSAQKICGPAGRNLNWGIYAEPSYSTFQVGLHRLSSAAPVGQPDMLYVRGDQASIDTPSGVVTSDLRLGSDDGVSDWSQSGDHVAILTMGHRIFLSNDGGRHWHQE
jgi:hypothetical protein